MLVMLLAALLAVSCHHSNLEEETFAELSVSIYIPEIALTKAETGYVGALDDEKIFSSLHLWAFVNDDGELVGYKEFATEHFALLSQEGTKVDVYAVANAASAGHPDLTKKTSRETLDNLVISGNTFGNSPLTRSVPSTGLPMSGVLKGVTVTGGYPVLNISTVTLTRAVSKIRFVFCQQGTPATDTDPAVPKNAACVVKSITFGGTATGCQIAASEKLFTDHKYGTTDNLFEIDGYTPLETVLAGEGDDPLIKNSDLSISEQPDQLLFQSQGHEFESAQEYESRLDEAVAASSQVGPIYIRETDKLISGTIVYDVGEGEKLATFSMPEGDVLSRNRSWILYAYFAEATKNLQFKIVVLPWDKSTYDFDFTAQTVNVVRRFTIPESDPKTYKKVQNDDGYYDIYFWHTLNEKVNTIKGDILIATPVGQKLHVVPVAGALEGHTKVDGIFSVTPLWQVIYPNKGEEEEKNEDCKIEFTITCNPGSHTPAELEGNYIDLHFCVEIGDSERWIDLDTESIDYYRIILKQNWNE